MGENKGQTIFLSVIGIATLLVAIVGATFAYFTTTMEGTAKNVSVTSMKIAGLEFKTDGISADNVLPGWSVTKAISVSTKSESDVTFDYSCKLHVTTDSGATKLTDIYVTTTNETSVTINDETVTGISHSDAKKTTAYQLNAAELAGTSDVTLFEGTIGSTEAAQTKVGKYTITFKETGAAQNGQQDASFSATVSCSTSKSDVYYTNGYENGTTTVPSAQW